MPVKHDLALRTPERIRAVAAMHRFGGAILLLIPVEFSHFIAWTATTFLTWEVIAEDGDHIVLLFALLLPATAGILAIMAGIGICRRRWWSRIVWWTATGVSTGVILVCLSALIERTLVDMRPLAVISTFVSIAYVILFGIAMVRYRQFRRCERRIENA